MKHTKKSLLFFIMQIVCFLVAPVAFIWLQSGSLVQGYKVSITAVIATIIVFVMFKKLMLNDWLKKISDKISQYEVSQTSAKDADVIRAIKRKWRTLSLIQLFINAVIPLACFVLFLMTIKVVEAGLIKLYGCLLVSALSMGLGIVFKVAEIYSVRCEHEQ